MKGYDAEAEIDDQDAERLSALYASARARGLPEPVYRELEPDEHQTAPSPGRSGRRGGSFCRRVKRGSQGSFFVYVRLAPAGVRKSCASVQMVELLADVPSRLYGEPSG